MDKNAANAAVISSNASRVTVRVIHTDEEWMIARTVCRVLGLTIEKEHDHEDNKGVYKENCYEGEKWG